MRLTALDRLPDAQQVLVRSDLNVPIADGGTRRIAGAIAGQDGFSVVGGGETISALKDLDLVDRIDHVSTGGGAALEFVADGDLPGLRALRDASRR